MAIPPIKTKRLPERTLTVIARRRMAFLVVMLLAALAPAPAADTMFVVYMDGDQVDPPTGSPATGSGWFILKDDHLSIEYQVSFENLSGPSFGGHVHRFSELPASPPVLDMGKGNPMVGIWQFPLPRHIEDLFAGRLYVNIHSQNFHLGEIQGTILAFGVPVEMNTWGRIKALYR